jgi:guanosine-diphosphatase
VLYQYLYLGIRTDVREETGSSSGGFYVDVAGYRKPKVVLGNPCLAKGARKVVNTKDEATGIERKVTMDR